MAIAQAAASGHQLIEGIVVEGVSLEAPLGACHPVCAVWRSSYGDQSHAEILDTQIVRLRVHWSSFLSGGASPHHCSHLLPDPCCGTTPIPDPLDILFWDDPSLMVIIPPLHCSSPGITPELRPTHPTASRTPHSGISRYLKPASPMQ